MVVLLLWKRNALVTLISSRVRAARASAVPGPIGDEEVTVEERVERAAAYVHDALAGRFRGVHWAVWAAPPPHACICICTCTWACICMGRASSTRILGSTRMLAWIQVGRASRIYAQRLLRSLRWVRGINLTVYVAIALVERPSWCYSHPHCGNTTVVMSSGMPTLSPAASQSVEAVCIALFACEMALKAYLMSPRGFFASPWHVLQILLLMLSAAVVLVQAIDQAVVQAVSNYTKGDEILDRPQVGVGRPGARL